MNIDFDKQGGLVPAIIQDSVTSKVLMLGYMNSESFELTKESKRVTFYSRSKKRLWIKGEESGNFLELVDMKLDCDRDSLLIQVNPVGPVCHTGTDTCWSEQNLASYGFLSKLEKTIDSRWVEESSKSYINSLKNKGLNKIAQKVGEEAVEVVIEAKDDNMDLFLNESADLLFHLLVLFRAKKVKLEQVVEILNQRHVKS